MNRLRPALLVIILCALTGALIVWADGQYQTAVIAGAFALMMTVAWIGTSDYKE